VGGFLGGLTGEPAVPLFTRAHCPFPSPSTHSLCSGGALRHTAGEAVVPQPHLPHAAQVQLCHVPLQAQVAADVQHRQRHGEGGEGTLEPVVRCVQVQQGEGQLRQGAVQGVGPDPQGLKVAE